MFCTYIIDSRWLTLWTVGYLKCYPNIGRDSSVIQKNWPSIRKRYYQGVAFPVPFLHSKVLFPFFRLRSLFKALSFMSFLHSFLVPRKFRQHPEVHVLAALFRRTDVLIYPPMLLTACCGYICWCNPRFCVLYLHLYMVSFINCSPHYFLSYWQNMVWLFEFCCRSRSVIRISLWL